jgi:hypothetical protein
MFHTPHLSRLISCIPKFQALNDAQVVVFVGGRISVNVPSQRYILGEKVITIGPVGTASGELGWKPLSLAQLYGSSLTLFHTVEDVYLTGPFLHWRDTENTQWLEFLHPFTAVKNLYLSRNFALLIASALEELDVEGAAEVLPALEELCLAERTSEAAQQAIKWFSKVRRPSGYPIVVSRWAQEREVANYGSWVHMNDGWWDRRALH